MKQALKIIAASALVTAIAMKAVPALAEPAPAPTSVKVVHTADLDLSTAAGRAALDQRLARAAYDVCGTASDADLAGKNQVRACRKHVLADARAKAAQIAARGAATISVAAR